MSPHPLADLQLGAVAILTLFQREKCFFASVSVLPLRKVLNLTSRNPAKVPLDLCPPLQLL